MILVMVMSLAIFAQTREEPKLKTQIKAEARPRKRPNFIQAVRRCSVILSSGPRAGQACDRKMLCKLHRKQNTAAASVMFVQKVFPMVLPFLAKRLVIPTMRNGRCFAAAYGLATAPWSDVKIQLTQCRNSIGCPINEDGTALHRVWHDEEVEASKAVASKIAAIMARTSPEEAQNGRGALRS